GHRAGGNASNSRLKAKIVTAGPLASALKFESTEMLRGGREICSSVEMEFPISKSWVRVNWTVQDPNGDVAALGADLHLNVKGQPTLVDFGAGTSVYAALRKGQTAVLKQKAMESTTQPSWQVLTGPAEKLIPFVQAPGRGSFRDSANRAE